MLFVMCVCDMSVLQVQVGGKLLIATTGGSSQKPSAIALLEVDSVDDLLKVEQDQWQTIRLSTKSEVSVTLFTNCWAASQS